MQHTYRQILSTILFKCLELKHQIIIKFSQNEASVTWKEKNISEICLQKCKNIRHQDRCEHIQWLVLSVNFPLSWRSYCTHSAWAQLSGFGTPCVSPCSPFHFQLAEGWVQIQFLSSVWTWGFLRLWPLSCKKEERKREKKRLRLIEVWSEIVATFEL